MRRPRSWAWALLLVSAAILTVSVAKGDDTQQEKSFEKEITIKVKLNYLLYLPEGYATSDKPWPMILFLHGAGESGQDLAKVKMHGPPKLIASPTAKGNGMVYERSGDYLVCESDTSVVSRFTPAGERTVVASHFEGAELNSPNDIVTRADDSIYFTDPNYGRWNDRFGIARRADGRHVHRRADIDRCRIWMYWQHAPPFTAPFCFHHDNSLYLNKRRGWAAENFNFLTGIA